MSDQGEVSQSQPSIKDRIGALLTPKEQPEPPEAPVVEGAEVAEEQEQTQEPVETQAPEAPEATPDEWVEIELDGEKLQVPPKFSKAFLQERDYTQKRQADAAYRATLEAREQGLQVQQQALQQLQPLYGKFNAVAEAVQQYEKLDWETLRRDDPLEFTAKRTDYLLALQQRDGLGRTIQQGHAYVEQMAEQAITQQMKAAEPLIRKAIPDWGPEKDSKLTQLALEKGATPAELRQFVATRPWAVELLDWAYKWKELQASKAQLPKKAQTLSPVAKPGAKPTHVSANAASYRKNQEQFRKSGGKDSTALRALLKAKLGG